MSGTLGDLTLKILLEVSSAEAGAKRLTQNLSSVEKSAVKVNQSTKTLSTQFKGLSDSINLAGLASGLVTGVIAAFTMQAIKAGFELDNLRKSFGGTVQDIELLRKATANTVSEANLLKLSNQASDLGFNISQQAKMFALAESSSDKYGGSLEQNFQKIVKAADGSAAGIRSIGIARTDYLKTLQDLEAATGRKMKQMSAEEQLQLRLDAIFKLSGITLESVSTKTQDAADKLQELGNVAEDVTSNFGVGLVKGFEKAQSAANDLKIDLHGLGSVAASAGSFVGEILAGVSAKVSQMVQQDIKDIKRVIDWYNNFKPAFFPELPSPDGGTNTSADKGFSESGKGLGEISTVDPTDTPGGTKGSRGKVSADKEANLLYLEELNKKLTELQSKIDSQSAGENFAEGLYEQLKKINDEIAKIGLINTLGYDAYLKQTIGDRAATELETIKLDGKRVRPKFYENKSSGPEASEEPKLIADDVISQSLSFAQQFSSLLGMSADSFGGKFLGYLQQGLSLANSFASILKLIFGTASGGILGLLGIKFASGGSVPGSGNTDSVPAMLMPGEFVMRKSVVQKLGAGFFEWINGGGLSGSLAGRYASGGMVTPNNQAPAQVYIVGAKVSGSDLRLVLERTNKMESRRLS